MNTIERNPVLNERQAEGGEVLLFPGRGDHLYRLKSGLIRLYTVDDDGVLRRIEVSYTEELRPLAV